MEQQAHAHHHNHSEGKVFHSLDDILSMFLNPPTQQQKSTVHQTIKTNVVEHEDRYLFSASLPGFAKDEITLTVKDGALIVEATAKETDAKPKFLLREYSVHQAKRVFEIPEDGDESRIQAKHDNGVLNLTIYKKPEKQPVNLTIQ